MSAIAIRVESISKQYKIGVRKYRHDTLRDQLMDGLRSLFRHNGRPQRAGDTIWALKDVSFEVKQGEVIGIIGANGAGKSTLLKILSRITEPTSGRAEIYGRVGSLLEVGTGFDRELTGRENIYLNGAILGMTKREIDRKFDEIVAFSGVEKFIETPIKRYSSGMYVRLAFAVAAHLEPEILIVDEVLAVGDAAFQKKCLGKMQEVAGRGRTVLFVSHNLGAVQNLCERVLVLSHGQMEYLGNTYQGINAYLGTTTVSGNGYVDLSSHPARWPGCLPLLTAVRLLDASGTPKGRFLTGETMRIELTFDPVIPIDHPKFGIGVEDCLGARVFSLTTDLSPSVLPPLRDPCQIICHIQELPLTPGRYTLSLSAGTFENGLMDALGHAVAFDVELGDFFGTGKTEANLGRVLVKSLWERTER